jgi:hypothetical protein
VIVTIRVCLVPTRPTGAASKRADVQEALALERPAMTYLREQLRQRLAHQVGQAYRRWLHPTSGRRPGDRFL